MMSNDETRRLVTEFRAAPFRAAPWSTNQVLNNMLTRIEALERDLGEMGDMAYRERKVTLDQEPEPGHEGKYVEAQTIKQGDVINTGWLTTVDHVIYKPATKSIPSVVIVTTDGREHRRWATSQVWLERASENPMDDERYLAGYRQGKADAIAAVESLRDKG